MILNSPTDRHQLSPVVAQRLMTMRDKRAHERFARGFAQQKRIVRDALQARVALPGSAT